MKREQIMRGDYYSKIETYLNKNERYHKEDGPAVLYYNRDGSIQKERYFLDGEEYNELEYWMKVAEINILKYIS